MWAYFIDDRTLLCLAVNVTKHGIGNFGRNNFKFSKTVAYITYIVFQFSLSREYVTLNRGFCGLWVRVCFLPPRSFRWAWHGMVDVFLAVHKSQSARNSRCISTVVAYFPTQNSVRSLCLSLQQSSSSLLLQWSSYQPRLAPVPQRCLNAKIWISAKQALVLACCVEGNVLLVQSITND